MKNLKKALPLFLALVMVICAIFTITSCSSSPKLSGKYYHETLDNVYFEFDGKNNCKLVTSFNEAHYVYTINDEVHEIEDDQGKIHKTYTVHISDTNSSSVQKLVYDSYTNTILDLELGTFSKKN